MYLYSDHSHGIVTEVNFGNKLPIIKHCNCPPFTLNITGLTPMLTNYADNSHKCKVVGLRVVGV